MSNKKSSSMTQVQYTGRELAESDQCYNIRQEIEKLLTISVEERHSFPIVFDTHVNIESVAISNFTDTTALYIYFSESKLFTFESVLLALKNALKQEKYTLSFPDYNEWEKK